MGVLVRAPMGVAAMLPGRPKINNWALGPSRSRSSAAGAAISRAAGRWVDRARSTPCSTRGATLPTMTTGLRPAATAGPGPTCCPISAARRATSAAPTPCMARRSSQGLEPAQPEADHGGFVEACAQRQIRTNLDFNGPEQEGAGHYQVTQFSGGPRNGERCSAAAAYLHPVMNRQNLTVITGAHAPASGWMAGARPASCTGRVAGTISPRRGGR